MALRTAVVGGGTVSGRHLDALTACPHTDLAAVCDVDPDRAREMASSYGVTGYTDVGTMLAEADLDWLHVCTPVATHLDIATRSIEAGVPVLIEKPLTDTVEEYEQLAATAEEHGVRASVVHNHNFDPAMRELARRMEAGDVGKVRSVEVVYAGQTFPDEVKRGEWAFDLPGGEFEEGLPHPLYLLLRFGGYPRSEDAVQVITQLADTYEQDFTYDGAKVQYPSEDGVLCSTTLLPGNVPDKGIYVHGDDGVLYADIVSQSVYTLGRDYQASPVARALNNVERAGKRLWGNVVNVRRMVEQQRNDDWETKAKMDSIAYQIGAEARALQEGTEPPVPLEEGGWTMRLLEDIRQAAEETEAAPTQDVSVPR